ncbi:MAG: hypothetical protein ACLR23_08930 [Clostridia bacterium]
MRRTQSEEPKVLPTALQWDYLHPQLVEQLLQPHPLLSAKESIAIAIAAEQKQNQNPAPVVSTSIATPTAVVREQREKNDQKENVILATHNCRLLE